MAASGNTAIPESGNAVAAKGQPKVVNSTGGGGPAFRPFNRMPTSLALTPINGASKTNQWLNPRNVLEQPQFVVFEVATASNNSNNSSSNAFGHRPQGPKNIQIQPIPFLPFGHSLSISSISESKDADDPKAKAPSAASSTDIEKTTNDGGLCFTMVQLGSSHTQQQHRINRPNGRLLFDNPMFRQLPNWHFFGDDRRIARIPPVIPLLRIPVERTLLSIGPSPVGMRQLLLLGLLDLKSLHCREQAALGYDEPMKANNEEELTTADEEEEEVVEEEEDEEVESLPPWSSCCSEPEEPLSSISSSADAECPSSSSGVESMSSADDETTTTANVTECGGDTPLIAMSPAEMDDGKEDEDGDGGRRRMMAIFDRTMNSLDLIGSRELNSGSSSSNYDSSSTPNSPPTFDRRTLRMSRATRDAVLRLSISRRFYDDDEEEDYCQAENEKNETDEQMTLRIRHSSNGSGHRSLKSNASNGRTKLHPEQNHSRPPFTSGGISCMDVLSERIYNFHQTTEQGGNTVLNRKLMLRDQLYYAISTIFPTCGLYIVGSSLNGFGTTNSDLDLCLLITPRDIDQRTDALVILTTVKSALDHNPMVVEQQLIPAKVPILRIKCDGNGVFSGIMVDLNVNNSVAIRNTHLMCYYSGFDYRVRPLVIIVKEWAKRRGINNASCSTFTSYSLVLMVIHYLQCGANPHVLPSLQSIYPRTFANNIDVRQLNVSQPLDPQPSALWEYDQRLSLSDLLLGFLKYYAYEFNFDRDAISIRLGRTLPRSEVAQNQSPYNSLAQWHCICIEEPFTLSNAAHSIYDERIFEEIKKAFIDSYEDLDKHRDLDRFLGQNIDEEIIVNGNANLLTAEEIQPASPTIQQVMTAEECATNDDNNNSNSIIEQD